MKSLFLFVIASLLGWAATPAPAQTATPTAHAPAAPHTCTMAEGDAAWVEQAIKNWNYVAREKLRLGPRPLPTIVVVDARCSYVSTPSGDDQIDWSGTPHSGSITLPDGTSAPVGVTAFAKPLDSSDKGFFVMSLPSLWHAAGVKSGIRLEALMNGVLLHELMHAYQFYFANPTLAALIKQYGLPEAIGDDSLQEAFENNENYVADYHAERDLLYEAAAAPDDEAARRLAQKALDHLRARRAKWFTGEAEKWAPLDEIFLTMEGLGQWVIYAWFRDPRGEDLDHETALREARRGRSWTQDEGLALFLVVDRLVPDWQKLAFAPKPETAEALLERAATGRR